MNNYIDQADGLRRIMAGPNPRIISILSAEPNGRGEKPRMMTNLALAMMNSGLDPLLVSASPDAYDALYQYGLNGLPTLMSVAQKQHQQLQAIKQAKQGYSVANLMNNRYLHEGVPVKLVSRLDRLFSALAHQFDAVLVDTELAHADDLPLPILNRSEIVIELNQHPESIKQAYSLIKRLYGHLGPRSFGIFINGIDGVAADKVFLNIAQVAKRYLSVELEYMGAIPFDDHLKRAKRLGRPVVDVFPMAMASMAFRSIAQRLNYYASFTKADGVYQEPSYQ